MWAGPSDVGCGRRGAASRRAIRMGLFNGPYTAKRVDISR